LRQRLHRQLGKDLELAAPTGDGPVLDDEAMLRLLQSINIVLGAEWAHALETYHAAQPSDGSELALKEQLATGWGRVVWGRIKVPFGAGPAGRVAEGAAGAFSSMRANVFAENYHLAPEANLEGYLLETALKVERGEMVLRRLTCQSPAWVAARLWDRISPAENDIDTLRSWVDRWKILSAPEFAPSTVWDGPAGERFRQSAFHVLETEAALEGWKETYSRFVRELAAARGQAPEDFQRWLPAPPQTFVDRALWLADHRIETLAHESLSACDDVLALVRLLLADIEKHRFSAAPHPHAVRLFHLAESRPDVFFCLLLSMRWRPRLLADLLLHPPTCALACLIIGQWDARSGGFDRELALRGDEQAKAAAFEDAVSILIWWLEKGLTAPAEAAALLVWLHNRAADGFIDDLVDQEPLRMILRNALFLLSLDKLEAMVNALTEGLDHMRQSGGRFAVALELIAIGELAERIDPVPLIDEYVGALTEGDVGLSVQRIGAEGARALFTLAHRKQELLQRFFYPIDMRARLAQGDSADANPYAIADALAGSLRAHIRILCRAVAGHATPAPENLAAALTAAVRSGALSHKEKGRVAAFAPRYEANALGLRRDRPLANDLAVALLALSDKPQKELLSAILETDEPMVLAQLLPLAPREARSAIEQRIEALPPADSGTTYTLTEVQARIDELLSAGALGAAAKFIAEEERIQTFGKAQGREVARLRSAMRLLFARRAWNDIMSMQLPPDLGPMDKENAQDVLQFYKGLTLLVRPDGRAPEAAERIFQTLYQRRPNVTAYAINVIAAKIGALLPDDMFSRLKGARARHARQILAETNALANSAAAIGCSDRETLAYNKAILQLALGEPAQALALLQSVSSARLDERMQAYRAVALARLGRSEEAVTTLQATEDVLGKTELLEAAWAQIRHGAPFAGSAGVSSNDDPVARIREAYRDLHLLNPIQQAAVVSLDNDPLTAFVTEQVREAASSIVSLVRVMKQVKIDTYEDDVTAVIRELLLSRLNFLRWHSPDQSKGGTTALRNPGERDLMIMRGSTILTVIEAVVCRDPVHWKNVQENLRAHFQKLFAYATCRLFFLLTYVYNQDVQSVINQLKTTAERKAPPGFSYVDLTDIALTDSQPHGFVARYGDEQGELKVVFLALNMGQERQLMAAEESAKPAKQRRRGTRGGAGNSPTAEATSIP
jgi:hypothetical protein